MDTGWRDDSNTRRSISRYVFFFRNSTISWSAKKQVVITFFIYEAEIIK
jgi:hypothetical protein